MTDASELGRLLARFARTGVDSPTVECTAMGVSVRSPERKPSADSSRRSYFKRSGTALLAM